MENRLKLTIYSFYFHCILTLKFLNFEVFNCQVFIIEVCMRLLPSPSDFIERKKWSKFDLKIRVTGGIKIRPLIPSNWRTFESN